MLLTHLHTLNARNSYFRDYHLMRMMITFQLEQLNPHRGLKIIHCVIVSNYDKNMRVRIGVSDMLSRFKRKRFARFVLCVISKT